jgi:hypothetical protein
MGKVRRKSSSTKTSLNSSPDNSEKTKIYCRKCMQTKNSTDFYQAVDFLLDSNGYMSICRDCIQEMLEKIERVEISLDKTILKLCRSLNVKYEQDAIDSIKRSIETIESDGSKYKLTFGKYLILLNRFLGKSEEVVRKNLLVFKEPNIFMESENLEQEDVDKQEYLNDFWGEGFNPDDYKYLEKEFSKWISSTQISTQSEIVTLKEICYKQNDIRKARLANDDTAKLVNELQVLMKNGALTPDKQNAASAGANYESYGRLIKIIEKKKPCEIFDDQEKYVDHNGFKEYSSDYFIRCMKNYVTQSRDFEVGEIDKIDDDENILEG